MESKLIKRGFTGFDLKIIALVFMIFSHIQEFFEFTGVIPAWFQYVGNITEPLFLFMIVEGFIHTSNRKKYILRMYLLGLGMSIANSVIYVLMSRPDGMYVRNNIIFPYMMVLVFLTGIDYISKRKIVKGIFLLLLPIIGEIFLNLMEYLLYYYGNTEFKWALLSPMIANPFTLTQGEVGIDAICEALALYLLKDKKITKIAVFCSINIIWSLICIFILNTSGIHNDYFVAEICVQPIVAGCIYLYNGQRGRRAKNLFYIFYPAHIYIFYFVSLLVYGKTMT